MTVSNQIIQNGGPLNQAAPLVPTPTPSNGNAIAAIASNAAATEALASIWIAKQFPRDYASVTSKMRQACSRPALAQVSTYSFKRGGSAVEGPSIRLAEALLSAWGNAEAGWKELSRSYDPKQDCTVSQCIAWCYDKEENLRREIAFTVPHTRDKNENRGGQKVMRRIPLESERDIYELCANMASRRIRACILEVLPGWLTDEAMATCRQTLASDNTPLSDRQQNMLAAFQELGVNKSQIENMLGKSLQETTNADIINLGKIYNAIKDGAALVRDYFDISKPRQVDIKPVDPSAPINDQIPGFPPVQQPQHAEPVNVHNSFPDNLL